MPPDEPVSFDRVRPPDPMRLRRRDTRGKRALFSVDTESTPTHAIVVSCRKCGIERGVLREELLPLLAPPWIANPIARTLWARCPTCRRRTWLKVKLGPGIPWPLV